MLNHAGGRSGGPVHPQVLTKHLSTLGAAHTRPLCLGVPGQASECLPFPRLAGGDAGGMPGSFPGGAPGGSAGAGGGPTVEEVD